MAVCAAAPALPAGAAPGAGNEGAVVEKVVRDSIGWALTKDRARLESLPAQEDDLSIHHPDSKSTVRGRVPFAKLLDEFVDPRFEATRFEVRDLAVRLSGGGAAAG